MTANRQIVLASRPRGGRAAEENFRMVQAPLPSLEQGEFLVRNRWLSIDPYMRGRMDEAKSYARCVELGEVMEGDAVGEVVDSRNPEFPAGEWVVGRLGWQEYARADTGRVRKIDVSAAPASWYLGILGMPGVTAWIGLVEIAQPRAGETVVVSAASGAVGSVVGQLARMQGCRAVGIAGGPAKCSWVRNDLQFDACVDYKAGRLYEDLRAAVPSGIDVDFENVGGEVFDTVLCCLNPFSRIALCGMVSLYDTAQPYAAKNLRALLVNRVRLQGFIVSERMELWPRALGELTAWVKAGRLKYRESVAEGLENAPRALLGVLTGHNFGKQVVKLA